MALSLRNDRVSTSELALSIVGAVGLEIQQPRENWRGVLTGDRLDAPPNRGFWVGRPHIHLVRFSGQAETATENQEKYGAEFGRILAQVPGAPVSVARSYLPKNSRSLEDYAVYNNGAAILWVWARSGIVAQEAIPWAKDNPGQFIDEHEVVAELLEFGHISHRRLLAETEQASSVNTVLRAQEDLLAWESAMREASCFGEIREFLSSGWALMGVQETRQHVERALAIQQTRVQLRDADREARWERGMTLLFGMLAVPPVASELVRPLWVLSELPRPISDEAFTLLLLLIAVIAVAITLAVVRWSLRRQ